MDRGVFEGHVPAYDHFAFVDVSRPTWQLILRDLTSLRVALERCAKGAKVTAPCGRTRLRTLATHLTDLESWLQQMLADHDEICVLGL